MGAPPAAVVVGGDGDRCRRRTRRGSRLRHGGARRPLVRSPPSRRRSGHGAPSRPTPRTAAVSQRIIEANDRRYASLWEEGRALRRSLLLNRRLLPGILAADLVERIVRDPEKPESLPGLAAAPMRRCSSFAEIAPASPRGASGEEPGGRRRRPTRTGIRSTRTRSSPPTTASSTNESATASWWCSCRGRAPTAPWSRRGRCTSGRSTPRGWPWDAPGSRNPQ